MAIVQTVNIYEFREAFRRMDRQDQFSYEGLEVLFDYLDNLSDDIGEPFEPDVIATTKENQKYLIVFCFDDYVRHKQSFGFYDLTCLSVNLTRQKLNSLENFLLTSSEDKHWINNDVYFKGIEVKYKDNGKLVKLVSDEECKECKGE
jgi:hypothetical protein